MSADKFLKGLQFNEADGQQPSDISYGGVGYSGAERPDLSNTHFLMDCPRRRVWRGVWTTLR